MSPRPRQRWGVGLGCLALFLLVAESASGAAPRATARFALVVGNNQPAPGADLDTLRYADDDALGMDALLRQAGVTTVLLTRADADSRRLHARAPIAGPPTLVALWRALARLAKRMRLATKRGQRSELLLFYSGHGDVAHGEGYLVFEDGRLTRQRLYQQLLARSPAHTNHVIVDACKAYLVAAGKGPGGARRPYRGPAFADELSPQSFPNTGFILSSSSARDSHEWEEYQAGVFTHQMRSALRGAADANGDRRITYAEIGAFLATANRSIANPRFRPDFVVMPPGARPRALSRTVLGWQQDAGPLTMGRGKLGHVYVESAQGERLLDAHPQRNQRLLLHLPASRPLFVRSADGRREVVVQRNEWMHISQLEPQGRVVVARKGALHLAFRRLFTEPFSVADVGAFERRYLRDYGATVARANALDRASDTPRAWQVVRSASGWTAIGAAAVGAGLHAGALGHWLAGQDAAQSDRPAINDTISSLNVAAITLYSVAVVAGATWLTLHLLQRRGRERSDRERSGRERSGVSVLPTVEPTTGRVGVRIVF